jgi:serine/threonine protein kinase
MNQEGGKFIAAGTYGCIFDPPLLCQDSRIKGKGQFGKITAPIDFLIENEASRVLAPLKLPYFIVPELGSACSPAEKQKEKQLGLCDPLKEIPLKQMVQFTMPYGGKTLFARIVDRSIDFFSLFQQLLEAGSYLIASSFVHYDISINNVVISEKGQVALIDFGQSFSAKNITQETLDLRWKVYNPEYETEPPEITVATAIGEGVSPTDAISQIVARKGVFPAAAAVLGLQPQKQEAELRHFWQTSRAAIAGDRLTMWRLYWPTFDSWGIGNCLISVLRGKLLLKSFTENPRWKKEGKLIRIILRGMLQANPRKRLDCVEALKLYDPENAWFSKYGVSWVESRASEKAV